LSISNDFLNHIVLWNIDSFRNNVLTESGANNFVKINGNLGVYIANEFDSRQIEKLSS